MPDHEPGPRTAGHPNAGPGGHLCAHGPVRAFQPPCHRGMVALLSSTRGHVSGQRARLRSHGPAGGHASESLCGGRVCWKWRQQSEKFPVSPQLQSAVTQVVAGWRRLCGGQEFWLRAPRPHIRLGPVTSPLEGSPSIFPSPAQPRRSRESGECREAAVPIARPQHPPAHPSTQCRPQGSSGRRRRAGQQDLDSAR